MSEPVKDGEEFVKELFMQNEGADRITYRKLSIKLKDKVVVDRKWLEELLGRIRKNQCGHSLESFIKKEFLGKEDAESEKRIGM